MYDNSFFELSEIPKAQELADKFDSKPLCRQLYFFAHRVNPYLDTIEKIFHTAKFQGDSNYIPEGKECIHLCGREGDFYELFDFTE